MNAHRHWLKTRRGEGRMVLQGLSRDYFWQSEVQLTGVRLVECNLSGASLRGAWFTEAELIGCDLSGCDLSGSQMNCTLLKDCKFDAANLREADISSSIIENCSFTAARLQDANLVKSRIHKVNFSQANFTQCILKKAQISESIFREAEMFSARLDYAFMTSVDLTDASIDALELEGTWFSNCVMTGIRGTPFVFGNYDIKSDDPATQMAFDRLHADWDAASNNLRITRSQ